MLRKLTLCAVAFTACYALAGALLLPWLARRFLPERLSSALATQVSIAAVRFNPFTFAVTIENLSAADAVGGRLFAFDALRAKIKPTSLYHRAYLVSAVEVVRPSGRLVIFSGGRSNLPIPPGAGEGSPKGATKLPRLEIGLLRIKDGSFDFRDESGIMMFERSARDIDVSLENFALTGSAKGGAIKGTAGIGSGAVRCSGSISLLPLRANLTAAFAGLKLAPSGGYLARFGDLSVLGGVLGGNAIFSYGNEPGENSLRVHGDAWVDQFVLADINSGEVLAQAERLGAAEIELLLPTPVIRMRQFELLGPVLHMNVAQDGTLNLSRFFGPSAPPAAAPPEAPGSELRIDCGKVAVERGFVNINDASVRPEYHGRVELTGRMNTLSTHSLMPAGFELHGNIDGHSEVVIQGELLTSGQDLQSKAAVKIHGVSLPALAGYTSRFLGYPVERGLLLWDADLTLEGGSLQAHNRIELQHLRLGKRASDSKAPQLPLPFALALLRDRQGRIRITLPVSGRLGAPEFSYFGIVRDELVNIVLRAAASPFTALAAAAGVSEDVRFVAFAPGSAVLENGEQNKLDTVAALLKERESLLLTIKGAAVRSYDAADGRLDEQGLRLLGDARARTVQDYLLASAPGLQGRVLLAGTDIAERRVEGRSLLELTLAPR